MRDTSAKITELCEAWWGRLADSTRAEQHHYAEQFLELLGWPQALPFSAREAAAAWSARPYVLRAGG